MKFFQTTELDDFKSEIGKNYRKSNGVSQKKRDEVRDKLRKGVYAKTSHWANLVSRNRYQIEFRNDWQINGIVRKYTWAKIFIPGYESAMFFFTVGVEKSGSGDCCLCYKLDCQRKNGLSPSQITLFDDFRIRQNIPFHGQIKKNDLVNYNWNTLVEVTSDFINAFNELYFSELEQLIWPQGRGVLPKVSRIVYNSFNWEKPSGKQGKSIKSKDSFEHVNGYGLEEWLFDFDRLIDGYHYAFLQPLNQGDHIGKTYDIHLYTVKTIKRGNYSESVVLWVGRIKRAEVISKQKKVEVFEEYRSRGWIDEMEKELQSVELDGWQSYPVSTFEMFNFRFRPNTDDVIIFEKPIEIPHWKTELGSLRYKLLAKKTEAKGGENSDGKYVFQPGHNQTKTGVTTSVQHLRIIKKSLVHKKIQELMFTQLVKVYGSDRVSTEQATGFGTCIDVVVRTDSGDIFYEVKTGAGALRCIREALGQILEYAYFPKEILAKKLIIVTPHSIDNRLKGYLAHLRSQTGLNLYYQVFDLENEILLEQEY